MKRSGTPREPTILCDYCAAPATRVLSRGGREYRSFACGGHHHRALAGVVTTRFGLKWVDDPLSGRPRHADLSFEELARKLRTRRERPSKEPTR